MTPFDLFALAQQLCRDGCCQGTPLRQQSPLIAQRARLLLPQAIWEPNQHFGDLDHRPPSAPALEQVNGWSKADAAKQPHDPNRALFGGWRRKDWEGRG